jgi:hypothetical protein
MGEQLPGFEETRLWQESLGQHSDGEEGKLLEKLRVQLWSFRENAGTLAEEIARDLPYFTVHDLRHIDALWDIAGEIAGEQVSVTPAEAFVLGGAFLVHDLGMASAAYPNGPAALEALPAWNATLATVMRRNLGKNPTEADLAAADDDDRRQTMEALLRRRHAKQAEVLVSEPVATEEKEGRVEKRHLIEDAEWRESFGRLIGRIAHSHWWSIERVLKEFPATINAPAGMPREWTIDPLKLACLLRTADAAHLDKLRAPSLLRLLRDPPGISRNHWVFQGALDPPRLHGDHLMFTSTRAFPPEDAEAWWLCLDALRVADRELLEVDALMADLQRDRFAAKGVTRVDSPQRIADFIPTADWLPYEAKIEVSDVAGIINSLGGAKLYGEQLAAPLRELIQNAGDAVQLRQRHDGVAEPVTVAIRDHEEQQVLEVIDFGSGMSPKVLTGALLDFGVSLWSSDLFIEEFPHADADFNPIGSFGIGFFSVFMWADRIDVISRRFDASVEDTYVLELSNGSAGRPLLRRAKEEERRIKAGTTVRLYLRETLEELIGHQASLLSRLCGRVAPAAGITILAEEGEKEAVQVVSADDWVGMPGAELLSRIAGEALGARRGGQVQQVVANLRPIEDPNGREVGRLALLPPGGGLYGSGVFVVGGLRSDRIDGCAGVLEGVEPTAARDKAQMHATAEEIAKWASGQRTLLEPLLGDPHDRITAASKIVSLGAHPGTLPICKSAQGFLNFEELRGWALEREEVLLLDLSEAESDFYGVAGSEEPFEPADNVIILHGWDRDLPSYMQPPGRYDEPDAPIHSMTLENWIEGALALAWGFDMYAELQPDDVELDEFWDSGPTYVGVVAGRPIEVSWVMPLAPRFAEARGWERSERQ